MSSFRQTRRLHQRWNWIQRPGDPVDPVTVFYNELQMSTYVWRSILRPKNFLIIVGKSKSSLHRLTSSDFSPTTDTWQWLLSFQHFKCTFCILGIFFENRKNSGLTRGQNYDPVTRMWKMTQMTHWPDDPVPCLSDPSFTHLCCDFRRQSSTSDRMLRRSTCSLYR